MKKIRSHADCLAHPRALRPLEGAAIDGPAGE